MAIKNLYKRIIGLFDPAGAKKYITQVSLILVSLAIATGADRLRESYKNREKLKEYCAALSNDIVEEIETQKMNKVDCDRDIDCLAMAIYLIHTRKKDSVEYVISNVQEVFNRGVFRSFKPSTLDIMIASGDLNLIKDLHLRSDLASAFAYRDDVIKADLESFDVTTSQCAEALGNYVNLAKLHQGQEALIPAKTAAFFDDPHNELYLLFRNAQLKSFHLREGIEELEALKTSLGTYMQENRL